MDAHLDRRQSPLEEEIRGIRTEISFLREHLSARRAAAADLWARSLVAETPLAERDFHASAEECRRVERALAGAEGRLEDLLSDRVATGTRKHDPVAGATS